MEYYADKEGNIYNSHDYQLKTYQQKEGYMYFVEYKDKDNRRNRTCHRFIYEYHNGEIPEGLEVNHINHDKTDNRLSNLILSTPKENNRHRRYCKLTMELAKEIRLRYAAENISYKGLADEYNVSRTTIHDVINLISWT